MLWYKAWLDTRWRFLIGLALMTCAAIVFVMGYPRVAARLPVAESIPLGGGVVVEQVRQAVEAARDYRGYVWWQWFRQSFRETWTLFAAMLGTGGLLTQASSGTALFTLSLPVSRRRWLAVRAATVMGELLVLALVPALVIPLLSPAISQGYGLGDALVHAISLFVAGSVFFSLAFLLSTVFADVWRPALIALGTAYALFFVEVATRDLGGFGLMRVMSAQTYYRSGEISWIGLIVAAAMSMTLLYAAAVNLERRDF